MLKSLKTTFRVLCFLLAVYLTAKQIMLYIENPDASVISYKRFNENPEDKYSTVSFCFANDPSVIYNDDLKELYPSKGPEEPSFKEDYGKLLQGENSSVTNQHDMWNRIDAVDPGKFINQLHTFISEANFYTKDETDSLRYKKTLIEDANMEALNSLFYLSYQDPDHFCFTRQSESVGPLISKRKKDEISFDFNSIIDFENFRSYNGYFRVYIHYPRQLIRKFDEPTYEVLFQAIGPDIIEVSLAISYVSVLKKRPDANKKCNASLIDDDTEFKIKLSKEIGCVPIYWISTIKSNVSLERCNTVVQYQQIHSLIKNSTAFMNSYDPPCIELMTPVNVQEKLSGSLAGGRLLFTIPYVTEAFQEIQNVNAFSFETLWSSAGGFVGIFLGYSLLQVPELFDIN